MEKRLYVIEKWRTTGTVYSTHTVSLRLPVMFLINSILKGSNLRNRHNEAHCVRLKKKGWVCYSNYLTTDASAKNLVNLTVKLSSELL